MAAAETGDALAGALSAHAGRRRRTMLKGLLGAVAIGATGIAGTLLFLHERSRSLAKEAPARAAAAEAAVLAGNFAAAKKLALEARDLDPMSREAFVAYLRVGSFDLVDGDGDANASVGLLAEARNLRAKGLDIALVSLAAAICIKNDRLTERVLKEPRTDDVTADGFYAFVAGAGFDLIADAASIEWYEQAVNLLKDPFLAAVRLVRALVFAGDLDRAEKALDQVPGDRNEHTVLANLIAQARALEGKPLGRRVPIDRARIGELPRSLRVLGTALALEDPDQPWGQSAGLDAALDDLDTPLAAVLAGRIALHGGDRVSARTASQAALRMREELEQARSFGARIALMDGDLPAARSHIGETDPDKDLASALRGIEAYESCDAAKLEAVDEEQRGSPNRWKLLDAVVSAGPPTLAYPDRGGTKKVESRFVDAEPIAPPALDPMIKRGEPWADLVAIDVALEKGDTDRASKLVSSFSNSPLTPPQKARKDALARAKSH